MLNFIAEFVNPVMVAAIQALTVGGIGAGIRYLTKKTGIEVGKAAEEKLKGHAREVVMTVEEIAKAQIKAKIAKPTAEKKQEMAVDRLLNQAPSISRQRAEELVLHAVGTTFGLGATGNMGTGELITSEPF